MFSFLSLLYLLDTDARASSQWDMAFPTGGSSVASSDSPSSNRHASTPEYNDILTPQYMAQYVQQPKLSNLMAATNPSNMSAAGGVPQQHVSHTHVSPHLANGHTRHQQHQNQHGLMQHRQSHGSGGAQGAGRSHQQVPHHQQHTAYSLQPIHISARDWQRSVASAFDPHGLKRGWN